MTGLLICVFTVFCLLTGPTPVCATNAKNLLQNTNALVSKIRERYLQINRRSRTYQKVKKSIKGKSTESGEMTAFFSNKQIVKITVIYYDEMGRGNVDFYFWEGKLIFVYEKNLQYDKPLTGRVISVKNHRYYFNEDRLIKWLEGKKNHDIDDPTVQDKQTLFINGAKELTELANSKDSP